MQQQQAVFFFYLDKHTCILVVIETVDCILEEQGDVSFITLCMMLYSLLKKNKTETSVQ